MASLRGRHIRPFFLACLLGVSGAVAAADVRIGGIGARTCAEWNEWKATNNGQARATTLEWAQGFLAGHNVYARNGRDNAPSVVADNKVLLPLLDSYCEKNAGQRVIAGVIGITQSLGGAKIDFGVRQPSGAPEKPREDKPLRDS